MYIHSLFRKHLLSVFALHDTWSKVLYFFDLSGQVILIQYYIWLVFLDALHQKLSNLPSIYCIPEIGVLLFWCSLFVFSSCGLILWGLLFQLPISNLRNRHCLVQLHYLQAGDWMASPIFRPRDTKTVKTELEHMLLYYFSKPVYISRL